MKGKSWSRSNLVALTTILASLVGATNATHAQDDAGTPIDRWRPKEGIYAEPRRNFMEQCSNFGDFAVELNKKTITGDEWICDVVKLAETNTSTIRLDLSCSDVNLAAEISSRGSDPTEPRFNETMTFRRIDAKSMFVRKTQNGKFRSPEWRVVYCPQRAQRAYIESKGRDEAEARQRTTEEQARPAAWRPRDGVYASPGADFDERCMKSGDAAIGLATNSVASGGSSCHVSHVTDMPPNTIRLDVICDQKPGAVGLVLRNGSLQPPGAEVITMAKIDDRTVNLHKTRDGEFSEPAQQLAYCPEAAQRGYVESAKPK